MVGRVAPYPIRIANRQNRSFVLFGAARITRRYPEAYGIENLAPESATTELLWPLVPLRGEGRAAEATTTLPDAAE